MTENNLNNLHSFIHSMTIKVQSLRADSKAENAKAQFNAFVLKWHLRYYAHRIGYVLIIIRKTTCLIPTEYLSTL